MLHVGNGVSSLNCDCSESQISITHMTQCGGAIESTTGRPVCISQGHLVFTDGRFGTPNNVSYFQNVSCTGNEVQLKDCNLNDSCSSSCTASTIVHLNKML